MMSTPKRLPPITAGDMLRTYRKASNLSQAELARQAHVDRTNLGKFENDKAPLSEDALCRVAVALEGDSVAIFDDLIRRQGRIPRAFVEEIVKDARLWQIISEHCRRSAA